MVLNVHRLWMPSGDLHNGFHGLTTHMERTATDLALLQEVRAPSMPTLPNDQPFIYDGPEGTYGRDAAFILHQDRVHSTGACSPIPGIPDESDLRWRLLVHGQGANPTAIASFWAPHIGCPESDRLDFWSRLFSSIAVVRRQVPSADVLLGGDSNLWVPGLVAAKPPRPAERACVAMLQQLLQDHGLAIHNPVETPTHRAGAALDLIIASPGIINSIQIHNSAHCSCLDRHACCPLLGSDHFAITVDLLKPRQVLSREAPPTPFRVRDWHALLLSIKPGVQEWSRVCRATLNHPVPSDQTTCRSTLDMLYTQLADLLWSADVCHYSRRVPNRRRQPAWWTDACFEAMLARNAAWRLRRRTPSQLTSEAFRVARNRFHSITQRAKRAYWTTWIADLTAMQQSDPRQAARRVRQRFGGCTRRIHPALTPSSTQCPVQRAERMDAWRSHFSSVAGHSEAQYDPRHLARIRRRIERVLSTQSQGSFDVPFTLAEVSAALRHCQQGKAPGSDQLPYEAFHVDLPCWRQALLHFLELCRVFACVPSAWKHGVVVPLHKGGSSTDCNSYRPITLTSCFAKLLERMILNRIQPVIDPMLDASQAGYRWGADVQVHTLLEVLRSRNRTPTLCAFLDIRKAFDVAWRDAALLRLHKAGVVGQMWALIHDMVSNRTAEVRIDCHYSDSWDVEDGIGQGAVLSGLLFNLLINGLAAAVRRACPGVRLGRSPVATRVPLLMYADDVAILADTPNELQRALDAATGWAKMWRFQFGIGVTKSAVMWFHAGRRPRTQLYLSTHAIPYVQTYRYLGVVLHERFTWKPHVLHVLARGEQRMAACLLWATRASLPLAWVNQIFHTYVLPSALYGIEHISEPAALALFRKRFLQWGRRLLMWPAGAPGVAVIGELGWLDLDAHWTLRSASLFARLLQIRGLRSRPCVPARVSEVAESWPTSWMSVIRRRLQFERVPDPASWAVGPNCSHTLIRSWCQRAVSPHVRACSSARFFAAASSVDSLQLYLSVQPVPSLCPAVYGHVANVQDAREWGLARCGHHCFADGRAARHRHVNPSSFCRFCALGPDTLEHALLQCDACADLRHQWQQHCSSAFQRNTLDLSALFHTRGERCLARDIANNVRFVASVCRRAAACSISS